MVIPNDFIKRHKWLCERLKTSRMHNSHSHEFIKHSDLLDHIYKWVALKEAKEWEFIEILSDGCGQAEPYWHGLRATKFDYQVMDEDERDQLAEKIAERRNEYRKNFETRTTTHRELGKYFSEPIVFCIKGQRNNKEIVAEDELSILTDGGFERWEDIAKFRIDQEQFKDSVVSEISNDLKRLCMLVLWPQFWQVQEFDSFLSLIYIQGSIVKSECGVWAMHIAASTSNKETPDIVTDGFKITEPSATMHFIDSAEQCLVHAIIAELHQGGANPHRIRMDDLNYIGRSLSLIMPQVEFDVAKYRFLNERFIFDEEYENYGESGYQDIGRKIYSREWQSDYLSDYSELFLLCLSRLTRLHPDYIRALDYPLLHAIRDLFVAKRVEEMRKKAIVEKKTRFNDILSELLVSRAMVTINGGNAINFSGLVENTRTWVSIIQATVTHIMQVRPVNLLESKIINCSLWAIVCLCSDREAIKRLPKNLERNGSESDWLALLEYCNSLIRPAVAS